MSKAYDRVEWSFLRRVLSQLGIHERLVHTIMTLVSSASYSLMLNGSQFGYFMPQRGIRQGDPLSPYLFLFVAEVFNCMLQVAERRDEIQGIAVSRGAPRISHLLFVDDTIIFGKAKQEMMVAVKRILETYGKASGQRINLAESSMVVSPNVEELQRRQLASILEVQLIAKHDKYLGLPAIAGKTRKELFQSIRDQMWDKVHGWHSKLLSQAGKGVLIKSVLQSISMYVMSCFRVPDGLIREMESMLADFWWHNMGTRRIHWVAWKDLCHPMDSGGLGFRHLGSVNMALLAKQGWRLITRPDSLISKIFQAKY